MAWLKGNIVNSLVCGPTENIGPGLNYCCKLLQFNVDFACAAPKSTVYNASNSPLNRRFSLVLSWPRPTKHTALSCLALPLDSSSLEDKLNCEWQIPVANFIQCWEKSISLTTHFCPSNSKNTLHSKQRSRWTEGKVKIARCDRNTILDKHMHSGEKQMQ